MRWFCISLKHLPLPADTRPKAPQRMSRMCLVKSCSGRSRMPTNYIMIASPPYRLIRRHVSLPFARILRGEEQIRYFEGFPLSLDKAVHRGICPSLVGGVGVVRVGCSR